MDETSEMDPQLARLLSSLTLSATVRDELSNGTGVAVNQSGLSSAPTSDVSGDSPIVTHPPEQSDWSSSVPPDYLQPPDAPPPSKSSHNPSSAESSSSLAVSSTRASQPMVNGIASHTDQNPNNAIRTTTPSPPSAVSPTSQTSRRASSTADISPYLSRAAEVPTSAKRLQQLSLLESVANESERIAARHAAMVSQGPVASPYPPPSPSFPPPTIPDTGVFYSSTYPIPPSSAAGFHTRQPLGNFGPGHPDPFQVRSRTSQAFHRGPMHHPTGSVNMSHSHLLATINGPHVGPVSASYQMNSQFIHQQQQQPQIFNAGPQFYPPQLNPRYLPAQPARQRYATHPLEAQPIGGRPYPPPNPNPAPGLTMAPPDSHNPTAMSLLSILNGRPTQQPAVPAQVHQ
ncbi:hypothetical protein BDZ97DRAFT_418230 [Flammula alnicola]|nr:hypothetical protein BDZ97DRAFT_418230 [Flammula alnicola]